MTTHHPDLAAEQAYLDHAYRCLERARQDAFRMRALTEVGRGGTHQARYERDVIDEAIVSRLSQLELRDAALVFGRIDREATAADGAPGVESFHIGRIAVADEEREPVVIDWRAPVAEPFYRATGRDPMGLVRRRHFSVRGRQLLAIEDELFGAEHLGIGSEDDAPFGLRGYSTLIAALEESRSGQLGDIVATIQAEQDEIIRSSQAGVLVVQGGPGTGKTVVALHRAAYLLYTFRFPLEDQGVLVIGPNRVFLRYIERVLPSLGEAGVEQVVLSDLVNDVEFGAIDSPLAAKVKGDARMADVLAKAVRDRERAAAGAARRALRLDEPADLGGRERTDRAARPVAATAGTTPVGASSRPSCSPPSRARSRQELTVDEVRDRTRHTEEVRDRTRADVAVAHAGPAPPRPVRLAGAAEAGGHEVAERRRAGVAHRPRAADVHAVSGRRPMPPCSTRPGPSSVPARPGRDERHPQRRHPRRRTTRSAPTATSSSTRCRTSRRCSCAWRRAAR